MQAKVRQMIQDEEQRARELEQEIALIQGEGLYNLQHGPLAPLVPLQQHTQAGDPFQSERGPFTPPAANFRAGTYPKYNGSTDQAQYIMSYQVAIALSGGDDTTMAKSFIISLEGPALTW
jgi:hypothetical protein